MRLAVYIYRDTQWVLDVTFTRAFHEPPNTVRVAVNGHTDPPLLFRSVASLNRFIDYRYPRFGTKSLLFIYTQNPGSVFCVTIAGTPDVSPMASPGLSWGVLLTSSTHTYATDKVKDCIRDLVCQN
jgi:hypothetical protein